MSTTQDQKRKRAVAGAAAAILMGCLVLLVPVFLNSVDADPGPPDPPKASDCAQNVHFYAFDISENFNGPAAPEELVAARAELVKRRCADPALTVQHMQYQARQFESPERSVESAYALMDNRTQWHEIVVQMMKAEESCTASIETMSDEYNTLFMKKTQPIPSTYQDTPDRPSFKVLRFSCADGSVWNYKLSCGFQPAKKEFVGVPGPNAPPPANVSPPAPVVPGVPPSSGRPTVPPTKPTLPTTTGLPKGPWVPPSSAQCANPDMPGCPKRPGNPVPPPPATAKPTPTVAPPSSRPPITVAPPPPQPTVTQTIVTPPTAPG